MMNSKHHDIMDFSSLLDISSLLEENQRQLGQCLNERDEIDIRIKLLRTARMHLEKLMIRNVKAVHPDLDLNEDQAIANEKRLGKCSKYANKAKFNILFKISWPIIQFGFFLSAMVNYLPM
jgi:hypothetical protein